MKYSEIIAGINLADTREQLKIHINNVDAALTADLCDYHAEQWQVISKQVGARLKEIESRALH